MADADSTKQQILESAGTVLVERGIGEFTTQSVADMAGVSQSLVHYYFDTKRELVLATFRHGLNVMTNAIETQIDSKTPRDRLLGLTRYMIRGTGLEDSVRFNQMLLGLESQAPYDDDLREAIAYERSYLREYVTSAVNDGIVNGEFRDIDADIFATMYVAAVLKATDWKAIFGSEADEEAVIAGLETIVDDFLVDR